MTEPLSAARLAEIRQEHREIVDPEGFPSHCETCSWWLDDTPVLAYWPCSTALLLAELDRREAQDRWPGRNHVSPWARR